MSRWVVLVRIATAAWVLTSAGCQGAPWDPSTSGSVVGDGCDPNALDPCGTGLQCYVPPNCDVAICCPPDDPANPVCYCAAADTSAAASGGGIAVDDAAIHESGAND
ncbi:MAG: hypothetical protein FWD17_04870 [Polyangiaceae bacterium]|nr:hypothetical protein [Polyangiaceae bacterium]